MVKNDVFKILYGEQFEASLIIFSDVQNKEAKRHAKKTIVYFNKNDLIGALSYIECIATSKIIFADINQAIYNARIVVDKFKKVVYKKYFQDGRCLEYSLAIGAVLNYLGFSFDFIIGQQINRNNKYKYHAWIEIDGVTINGRYDYNDIYTIIYKKSF